MITLLTGQFYFNFILYFLFHGHFWMHLKLLFSLFSFGTLLKHYCPLSNRSKSNVDDAFSRLSFYSLLTII